MTRVVLMTVGTLMLLLGAVSMVTPVPGGILKLTRPGYESKPGDHGVK